MNNVFVASKSDSRGMEALGILDRMNFRVRALDTDNGEIAPPSSIAFFTAYENTYHFPGSHLRVAAHRINGVAPVWSKPTPFLVALRPSPSPVKMQNFHKAIEQVAGWYAQWKVPDALDDVGCVTSPWGTKPTDVGNEGIFREWIEHAIQVWENSHSLASALMRHPSVRPHNPSQPLPSTHCSVYTMLCPHFVEHGVLGDETSLNPRKIQQIGNIFKEIREDAGGELTYIEAITPTAELAEDPWFRILPPALWEDPQLREKLEGSERALRSALQMISDISGVEIAVRPISGCPLDLFLEAVNDPAMPSMVDELIPHYINFQSDYSRYPIEQLREKIRWEHGLYLAVVKWLCSAATVVNLEVWTRSWDVAWDFAANANVGFNLWWPTTRQHFK